MAEAITYRVGDILEYADFKEDFATRIGRYNVSILNDIKELYLYDFGISIEIAPDEEQRAQLEANINMALSKGDINLEDAIDIRELKNLKLANQLLKVKRIKTAEKMEKMQMQKQAMVSQQQLQSQQMAAQMAVQKIQFEAQAKTQVIQTEIEMSMKKMEFESQMKSRLMAEEFQYNVKLHEMQYGTLAQREKNKEDEKNKRISIQNTQQSKLINQRKNNLPPMNFESNEDSLDGFDLAEFNPR